jgi:hypothetical protein
MFLNRADPPPGPARLDFRPYDLTVVRREQIKPEPFTISAAGVVHIQPGEPSQFIPLELWWRRASMFNTLRMRPFFRNYLPAKTHRLWCHVWVCACGCACGCECECECAVIVSVIQ